MKLQDLLRLAIAVLAVVRAFALNIPSDGSDGDFSPTGDIIVDLSLAPTGSWSDNNTANSGKGIYDPSKWAVVFKYSSVTIPSGVTVTFINHPTHAPVVWLVKGNVVINGTVSVKGQDSAVDGVSALTPREPGPGGFRGGANGPSGAGSGYGPGGGAADGPGLYSLIYGNPQIIPLIGGSGGGRERGIGPLSTARPGGAGGAILIAVSGGMSLSGLIDASGGLGTGDYDPYGSGGAVRVIAQQVSGTGEIRALNQGWINGYGRIRVETPGLASTIRIAPETIAVTPPVNPIIWPADDAPTVRVATVDGVAAPLDPTAPVASSADVGIQQNGTVQVILETKNFPIQGVVELRSVQKYGPAAWVTAAYSTGDFASSTWIANITFAPGFTTLQARATVP